MIYKCDSCGEIMDEKNKVRAGYKWDNFELCPSCGWEVVDFLQDKKLILLRQPSPMNFKRQSSNSKPYGNCSKLKNLLKY